MGSKPKSEEQENSEVLQPQTEEFALPDTIPVLPAKDLVAFPGVMMSFYITRKVGIAAIEKAAREDKLVLVLTQKDEQLEDPQPADLYRVGVVAGIMRVLKLDDDRYKVLIQGFTRAAASKITRKKGLFIADLEDVPAQEPGDYPPKVKELMEQLRQKLRQLIEIQDLPDDLLMVVEEIDTPGTFADMVAAHLKPPTNLSQMVLEERDPVKRLEFVDSLVAEDLKKLQFNLQIRERTSDELSKGQREYYLREQLRLIREELGEAGNESDDLARLKATLNKLKLPKLVREEAIKQLSRLERMNPELGDAALLRTYLDWIIDLPWEKKTKDKIDLKSAKEILDRDHHGLEKVKDRILEHLSVRKLNKNSRGPILCLVGPPGVGKTSLGRSVARALGRNFVRISLGGMRDEAEIRGHRRTYVGALPGRIIQGMKQAGSRNPVFVLDELDKVGADFRGDPAAALLEVLDPEQNKEYSDHYLNVPFDLSDVMFFATANTVDTIPSALLDRLEVIQIPGYTSPEKVTIARNYLWPKQLKESGLDSEKVTLSDGTLAFLVERYTQEAGVRNLEREIAGLCRKIARRYAEGDSSSVDVKPDDLPQLLGPTKYDPEERRNENTVGVATGLAWTVYGGDVLLIEVSVARGRGNLQLTGQLGEVMQESAKAAVSYARSNAAVLGLDPNFYQRYDIHIHVPAGATPKDGPSAGVTMVTALVSALSGRPVSKEFAMTGEITLRGNVLAVGGVKEKALAALRYGLKRVIIPHENQKDLADIPEEQRRQIEFIPVRHVGEVIEACLLGKSKGGNQKTKKVQLPYSGTV